MVIGDPNRFAVIVDEVPLWNLGDYSFRNGILFYCIDGILFPKDIQNATLSSDLYDLLPRMRAIPADDALFSGDKDDVFMQLYNLRFPQDWSMAEEYRFDLTPLTFSDIKHYVFAVKGITGIRILANVLPYLKVDSTHDLSNLNTLEAMISHQEYDNLVCTLETWFSSKS